MRHSTRSAVFLPKLKAGLLHGSRKHENEGVLLAFLAKPTVRLILPSRETADHYARLYAQLRAAGTPVPINNLWIAALVLEHHLTLCHPKCALPKDSSASSR